MQPIAHTPSDPVRGAPSLLLTFTNVERGANEVPAFVQWRFLQKSLDPRHLISLSHERRCGYSACCQADSPSIPALERGGGGVRRKARNRCFYVGLEPLHLLLIIATSNVVATLLDTHQLTVCTKKQHVGFFGAQRVPQRPVVLHEQWRWGRSGERLQFRRRFGPCRGVVGVVKLIRAYLQDE